MRCWDAVGRLRTAASNPNGRARCFARRKPAAATAQGSTRQVRSRRAQTDAKSSAGEFVSTCRQRKHRSIFTIAVTSLQSFPPWPGCTLPRPYLGRGRWILGHSRRPCESKNHRSTMVASTPGGEATGVEVTDDFDAFSQVGLTLWPIDDNDNVGSFRELCTRFSPT